jgi:DNA-binding NtrC family response regulator
MWLKETERKAEGGDNRNLRTLAEIERQTIEQTLKETGGDKSAAARILGINKSTLYRKLKQYLLN